MKWAAIFLVFTLVFLEVCLGGEGKLIRLDENQRIADQDKNNNHPPRSEPNEMDLLKKTIRSTEKILEKFARNEKVIKDKRIKLIKKGIRFVMATLERTNAIERNPEKEIVRYDNSSFTTSTHSESKWVR